MRDHDKIYIDGAWVPSTGTGSIEVVNASTEQVMGSIPEGTAEDVDKAVAAAKINKAFCQPVLLISSPSTGTMRNCPKLPAAAAMPMAQERRSAGTLRPMTP